MRSLNKWMLRICLLVVAGLWVFVRPLSGGAYVMLSRDSCVNRLRMLYGSSIQYAIHNDLPNGTKVSIDALKPYLGNLGEPYYGPQTYPWICPVGGTISPECVVGVDPTCSLLEEDAERHHRLEKKLWDDYYRTQTVWWRWTHPRSQW